MANVTDVDKVVSLLNKVADQVGHTAATGLPYLVRHELIQGIVVLSFGAIFLVVGMIATWLAVHTRDHDDMVFAYGVIAAAGILFGAMMVAFGIPQVMEPTGSVIEHLLKVAVAK